MQIFSAEQIRAWDAYTIAHEPIASIDLMERAAGKCAEWLKAKPWAGRPFKIFCGKGNNGGDGLAIARMLLQQGYTVSVYILEFGKLGSDDFQQNLQRLHDLPAVDLHFIQSADNFPALQTTDVVVDALFGSGLNKPLEGLSAQLVHHLNNAGATVVAIDLPSGLFLDRSSAGNAVVTADYTLTFQCYKLALLVQENAVFIGAVQVLDIGLHPGFPGTLEPRDILLDEEMVRAIYRPRNRFAHKGAFGHALIVGGSWGKMGALVLAASACSTGGAGLTTCLIPRCGYVVMQTAAPEVMTITDDEETHLAVLPDDVEKYAAIAIGPGMGTHPDSQKLLSFLLRRYNRPLVIDADGLNCLAANPDWLQALPPYSILTPHPKEFDRLFGDHRDDFSRIDTARKMAQALRCILVVKGHHSFVAVPEGPCFFNSTGTPGMAKGGSGDVLTGVLAALLAQGYAPVEAACFGVYIHGWAGEFAARSLSVETMLPGDTITSLSDVFRALASWGN